MKFAIIGKVLIVGVLMAGCSKSPEADNPTSSTAYDPTNDIWSAFTSHPGNADQGVRYLDVKGRLIKRGTVPPSAISTSAKGPLPAYLACYDYVMVMSGLGDIESDICVFYIDNPTRGTHSLMWKGKQYLGQLEQSMSEYGFTKT